ncbi:MAG: hypothetical protein H7X95_14135 [Deltaproteobacteria bacterium]|nr:hypothetical protein [Deltaproteobacteria bacterium]
MDQGSLYSNLYQKKPDPDEPSDSKSSTVAPDTGEAKIRRRLAVELAVNESMAAAGVETSQYKQSSKRVDQAGLRVHVMVDLGRELAEVSVGLLSQVGASIVQRAKAKGEVDIAMVYWRMDTVPGVASPVNLVRQAIADKTDPEAAKAPTVAPAVVSAPTAAAKVAASEKIAKLRAMMGDSAPPGAADPSYEKTQVSPKKGDGGSSFEKTQVIHATTFQATQVMDEGADKDAGKSGKS